MPLRICTIDEIVENTPIHKTFYFEDEECRKAKPGQFVMVWIPGVDEMPVSLSFIQEKQAVTVEVKGEGTKKMHETKVGDKIGIRGPYGNGFSTHGNKLLFVAGGTGIAPLLPLIKMVEGEKTVILGARTSSLLLFEKELKDMGVKLYISTDDGSKGHQGFATDIFENLIEEDFDTVYTCGPETMMKKVLGLCLKKNVPMQASLERYMKCGIGICDSCSIDGYHVCKDGPVFSGDILKKMGEFGKWKRKPSGRKESI
ncbi:MAG: dihydroorotate dehydrogenase electron transfer subunit [Candidatus Thermoplasmatota archaeon]|nr:dihydroorotate dehydrogenase electron transfer subunit [Candidatus Thermoplasmatota archaeon]